MAKGAKEKRADHAHAPLIEDTRFSRLHTDPRFLRAHRDESKVVLDDRFKHLLQGEKAKRKTKTDKFGRKSKQAPEEEDDLHRLYRVEHDESGENSEDDAKDAQFVDYARGEGDLESSGDEESSSSDDDNDHHEVLIGSAAARRKFGRDEDNVDELSELGVNAEQLAKLDARAEETVRLQAKAEKGKPKQKFGGDTARLAVVNMDWDHIRAIDLYKVFQSVVSPAPSTTIPSSSSTSQIVPINGRVINVRVYPSEFGRKRMAKESQEGPPKEIFKASEDAKPKKKSVKKSKAKSRTSHQDEESDGSDQELFNIDEGGEFDEEALRNYQLERLRYYYAIVTFDSAQTARYIMDEIDGTEMEHTANMFDLSFVPHDMTFPNHESSNEDPADEGWRDEADASTAHATYQGVDFTTDALRHSKVKLTWDADDPQRSKVTRQLTHQALSADQLRDDDFKAYLASASEDSAAEESETEGAEDRGERLRSLLKQNESLNAGGFGKAKSSAFQDGKKSSSAYDKGEGDMEITFMPGLSEAAARKKKGEIPMEETTIEKYKRKQREKRERRKLGGGDMQEDQNVDKQDASHNFDDPFFASDNEIDFDQALAEEKSRGNKKTPQASLPSDQDQFGMDNDALDIDNDEDDGVGHYSLKDILKAEQAAQGGKKSRWAKKKEKKLAKQQTGRRDGNEIQPGFSVDVNDERFSGLFGDHRYALDPSHPNFVKTKGMKDLVEERRKRQNKTSARSEEKNGEDELSRLVQSVKKRTLPTDEGKTTKRKKHSQT